VIKLADEEEESMPFVEYPVEYFQWKNQPAAEKRFKEIMKDIPLGNFTEKDALYIFDCYELQKQLDSWVKMGIVTRSDVRDAIMFLQFLALSKANISLGINATARKLDQSAWQFKRVEKKEPKRPWMNWGRQG